MKKRNESANCENCPYSFEMPESDWMTVRHVFKYDCRASVSRGIVYEEYWCGSHPDFFLPDKKAKK
jgi:hypothetical protein